MQGGAARAVCAAPAGRLQMMHGMLLHMHGMLLQLRQRDAAHLLRARGCLGWSSQWEADKSLQQ